MKTNSTSADVARIAGVSKWTVIRAFTPGARIADDTRRRVLQAARTLDYQPNLLARSLATRTTHAVAILVDDFANPFKLPTLERLTAALQHHGRLVTLININQNYDPVKAITAARQRRFDAIVLFGTEFHDTMIPELTGMLQQLPIFVLARESTLKPIPYVTCDTGKAMNDLCGYLADKGYRRPGFLAGPRALSTSLQREQAFRSFWAKRDTPLVFESSVPRYDLAAAAGAMARYVADTPPEGRCDLLMCENDVLALGAMEALRGAGVAVPHDIAVAGFDDIELAGLQSFDLTTYRQPYEAMVDALVDMLIGVKAPRSVKLEGSLVARGSA